MKPGKISENVLKRSVLKYMDYKQGEIARGAGIGNDCALFASGQGIAAATCSLSVGPREKMRHAIFAAANNLAASGQEPKYMVLNIILSERTRERKLQEMMEEATGICNDCGWIIAGGHTEVSAHISESVVCVTALSDTGMGELAVGITDDCDIVISGYIGTEAAGLIAGRKEEELLERFPMWVLLQAKEYKEHVSVAQAAKIAMSHGAVQMHDIGEGGVFAALWELGQRMEKGMTVDIKKIPMRQSVVEICNFYDVSPYEIWSQGCLLSVIKDGEALVESLLEADIPAAIIGKVTDSNDRIITNGEEIRYMDLPKPDQIRKLL